MPEYLVTWEVDVTAKTPRDAAEEARVMQTRSGTLAKVFLVADKATDEMTEIDLCEHTSRVIAHG